MGSGEEMATCFVPHLEHFICCYSQHGFNFRSGRSCLSNLLEFLDKVTQAIDEGNSVDVVYLDFAKATPALILLSKLRAHHGIRGNRLYYGGLRIGY